MTRLTPEREAEIRSWKVVQASGPIQELLAELDALRSQLAEAEQRGRELELADVTYWLRSTPRARGVLIGIEHSDTVARLAADLERGAHRKP